jgi:hypothetical protein
MSGRVRCEPIYGSPRERRVSDAVRSGRRLRFLRSASLAGAERVPGCLGTLSACLGINRIVVPMLGFAMIPRHPPNALGTGYRGTSSEELFDVLAQRQAIPCAIAGRLEATMVSCP